MHLNTITKHTFLTVNGVKQLEPLNTKGALKYYLTYVLMFSLPGAGGGVTTGAEVEP